MRTPKEGNEHAPVAQSISPQRVTNDVSARWFAPFYKYIYTNLIILIVDAQRDGT